MENKTCPLCGKPARFTDESAVHDDWWSPATPRDKTVPYPYIIFGCSVTLKVVCCECCQVVSKKDIEIRQEVKLAPEVGRLMRQMAEAEGLPHHERGTMAFGYELEPQKITQETPIHLFRSAWRVTVPGSGQVLVGGPIVVAID